MKSIIFKFALVFLFLSVAGAGFAKVKKIVERAARQTPIVDYIPLSQEHLNAFICGTELKPLAVFELIFLDRVGELSRECFNQVAKAINQGRSKPLFLDRAEAHFKIETLEELSFVSIVNSLGASSGDIARLLRDIEEFVIQNQNVTSTKVALGIDYLSSYSTQFSAKHGADGISLDIFIYHQLPLNLSSIRISSTSAALPVKIIHNGQELGFRHEKTRLSIPLQMQLIPRIESSNPATSAELVPTVLTLKLQKGDKNYHGLIKKVTMDASIGGSTQKPYLNAGLNVKEVLGVDECSNFDDFAPRWDAAIGSSGNLAVDVNTILIPKGHYEVRDTLHFPCDFNVTIEPGTSFKLAPDVSLFFAGSASVVGSEREPINFDMLEPGKAWGGLVFLPNTQSDIANDIQVNHVSIKGGRETFGYGRGFSGMLSVLGASVSMQNVRFGKNYGEDQLNLINSKVDVNGLTFEQAYSDAADFDWCRGSISNVDVTETGEGGDGIDFSYSDIFLSNVTARRITDKGVSVGEASRVWASNVLIEDASYGVVAKDSSVVKLDVASFHEVETPIAAYVKKPHFSGGTIYLNGVKRLNSGTDYHDAQSKFILAVGNDG